MAKLSPLVPILAVVAMLAGCAAPGKYAWGSYDRSLYRYYKDPTTADAHVAELKSIIEAAEASQARVAPGLYAEYGYFLLQRGRKEEARSFFEKERAAWPESVQLMTTMLKLTEGKKQVAAKEETR